MKTNKKTFFILIALFILILILNINHFVFAQGGGGTTGGNSDSGGTTIELTNPLSCEDVTCVVQKIINGIFTLSIPVTVLMILVGAFQLLTAGGQEEKIKSGKNTIKWAVIGFGLVIISLGLVDVILEFFRSN